MNSFYSRAEYIALCSNVANHSFFANSVRHWMTNMQRPQSTNKRWSKKQWKRGYGMAAAAADALGLNKKKRKRALRKWNSFKLRAGRLSWCQKMASHLFMIAVILMLCQRMMVQGPVEDIKVLPLGPVLVPDAGDADLESTELTAGRLTEISPGELTVDLDELMSAEDMVGSELQSGSTNQDQPTRINQPGCWAQVDRCCGRNVSRSNGL